MNCKLISLVAASMATAASPAQNLLVNGGLEGGTLSSCSGFVTLPGGSSAIPGWSVVGPRSIDWISHNPAGSCCDMAPEGNRTIDLNGSPAQDGGAIQQTIATQAGRRYRISLLALANGCCAPIGTAKTMRISTGSVASEHTLLTLWGSDSTSSPECTFASWTRIEREWTAVSATTSIEVRSLVPNSAGGIEIDDLVVTEVPLDLLVPSVYPTIASAVAASHPGDRVLIAPGDYPWTPATISHSLTIEATAGAMSTRFFGAGAATDPLLECAPGIQGSVVLRGLHIDMGRGIHASNGNMVVEHCLFTRNSHGVLIESDGGFTGAVIRACAFVGNGGSGTDQAGGLGVYASASDAPGASLDSCVFIGNHALEGGGFHVSHSASSVTDCVFARNTALVYSGGAIARWWGHVPIPCTNCKFTDNSAAWGGTQNWNCCVDCVGCDFAPAIDTTTDCNGDSIPDIAEVRVDPSVDANADGIIDECQAPPCLADIDNSGTVNGVDLAIVLQSWGVPSAKYPRADINLDGIVNGSDLSLVLSGWGVCP